MSWPLVKLGDVCTFENGDRGKNYPSKEHFITSGIPFINAGDLNDDGIVESNCSFISQHKYDSLSGGKIKENDILFCLRGSLGKFSIVKGISKGAIASSLIIIRVTEALDLNYFLNYLKGPDCRREIERFENGAAQPNLSGRDLKEFLIPLPPLPEQKRIAAILDKADAIRRKRQQAIKLTDEFLRSVFLEMFGDPVTNPKGWEVRSVGEIADCIVPGRDKPKSFTGSTPWVTTNDLNHLGFTLCSKSNIGLSEEEIKHVRARVVPKNSVLMTCVGDLGVVSISANDMVINQQLHAFLTSEKYTSAYLAYALSFQKGYMTSMASSTTLPYMNKTICNSVPVTVPPLPLQLQFENIFMRTGDLKNKLQRQEISPLFDSLSQKAFSGQL